MSHTPRVPAEADALLREIEERIRNINTRQTETERMLDVFDVAPLSKAEHKRQRKATKHRRQPWR